MATETAAFFWFDWQKISDSGHPAYGAYVYRQMLPHFSPTLHDFPVACYYFDDGDCLPQGSLQIPYLGPKEAAVLEQVRVKGPDMFYVVGVFNMGDELALEDVDARLRASGVIGYVGMTSCPEGITLEGYLALTRQMSLCHAFDIRFGTSFEKDSFAFLRDDELKAMGFEPGEAD
ncbi:hypothetical protein ACFL09_03225 [Planctomycetota bacterium]